MSSESKTFIQEIYIPLLVASFTGIISLGLQIARPIVRNRLYRNLIYWRADISNTIMGTCNLSSFMVVNESCFETVGDVSFTFQLYKDRNTKVILNEEQDTSTEGIDNLKFTCEHQQDDINKIYLGSPDEKTSFVLKPEMELQKEGWQTVIANRPILLAMNEATCIAVVLWNFPSKQILRQHSLYVGGRRCKSYAEYVTYRNYLVMLKECFYWVFSISLCIFIFTGGIICSKFIERRKSIERRNKESRIESEIEKLE